MSSTRNAAIQPAVASNAKPTELPSLNEALGSLQEELDLLRSSVSHIEQSKQAAAESVEAGRRVAQTAAGLASSTEALIDRLDRVDFPTRLDKLDATASALLAGFQIVQGRLDSVERNLQDAVRSADAKASERINALQLATDSTRHRVEGLVTQTAATQAAAMTKIHSLLLGVLGGVALTVVMMALLVMR